MKAVLDLIWSDDYAVQVVIEDAHPLAVFDRLRKVVEVRQKAEKNRMADEYRQKNLTTP